MATEKIWAIEVQNHNDEWEIATFEKELQAGVFVTSFCLICGEEVPPDGEHECSAPQREVAK